MLKKETKEEEEKEANAAGHECLGLEDKKKTGRRKRANAAGLECIGQEWKETEPQDMNIIICTTRFDNKFGPNLLT